MRTTRRGSSGSSGSSDSTSLVSNSLSPIPEEHYYRTWGEWPSTTTTGIQPPAYSLHSDYDSYLGIDEESDSGSSSVISFSVITDQLLRSDSIKNSETPKLSKKLLNHQHFDTKVKMGHTKDDEESSTLRLASESSYDSDDASSPRTPTLRRFKTHENLRQAIETDKHKNEDVSKTTEIHQPLKRHPAMSPNTWKKEFSQEMDRLSSDSSRDTHAEPKGMVSSASVATIQAAKLQRPGSSFASGDAAVENNAPESSQDKDGANESPSRGINISDSDNSAISNNFKSSSQTSAKKEFCEPTSSDTADYSDSAYSMHPSDHTSQLNVPVTPSDDTATGTSQQTSASSSGPKYGSTVPNTSRFSTGSSVLLPPPRISNLGSDPLSITARRQHQRNLSINSTNSPVRASVISHFSQYSPVVEEVDRVQVGTAQVRQMSSNESAALSTATVGNSSSSSSTTPSATVRTVSINRARASVRELEGMLTEIQALRRSISDHNKDKSLSHQSEDSKRQSGSAFPIEPISEDSQSDDNPRYSNTARVITPPSIQESPVTTGEPSSYATEQGQIILGSGKIPTVTDMSPGIQSQVGVTQTQSRSSSGESSASKPPSRGSSRNSSKPLPRLPTEEREAAPGRKSLDDGKPERSSSFKRKLFPWIGLRKTSPPVTQDASKKATESSEQPPSRLSTSTSKGSSDIKIPPTPPLATSKKSRYGAHNRQISMDSQWSTGTTFESSTDDIEELKTSIDSYRVSMNASRSSEKSIKMNKRMSAPPLDSNKSYQVSPTAKHEEVPKLPDLSYTWNSNMSLEQEMDNMLLPPVLPVSRSRNDSTQESSAESFQTAASLPSDEEEITAREAADTMPRSDSQRTQLNTRSPGQSSGTNTVTLQRDSLGILNNNMHRQPSLNRNLSISTEKGAKSREAAGSHVEDSIITKDIEAERRESSGTAKTSKGRGSIPSVGPPVGHSNSRNQPFAVPAKSPNRRAHHRPSDSLPGHISLDNDTAHPRSFRADTRDSLHEMSTWQREHKSSRKHHRNKSHAGNVQGPSVPSGGRPLSGSHRSVSMPSQVPKSASGTSRENSGLRRSRKAFSQANIEKLMSLADNSFQLDEIDLPPDEKHLLEKFVDALSKLSVEINLDDGKRLEGKRRLHNALRAIEGWI